MLCNVLPLHASYYRLEPLTYAFAADLSLSCGDLVEIPLKNKFCYGVVSEVLPDVEQ